VPGALACLVSRDSELAYLLRSLIKLPPQDSLHHHQSLSSSLWATLLQPVTVGRASYDRIVLFIGIKYAV